ncbi:S8 family serine peptidase [Kytococcus sp. Marseille-QA3725]
MRRTLALTTLIALATTCAPAATAADAPVQADLQPRVAATTDGGLADDHRSSTRIQLKLAEGTSPEALSGTLSAAGDDAVSSLAAAGTLRDLRPMVDRPASDLRALKATAAQRSGAEQADMSLWMLAEVDAADMDEALADLNADPDVEVAMAQPLPAQEPLVDQQAVATTPLAGLRADGADPVNTLATPDFTDRQAYRGPASEQGIEALAGHELPGGKGKNVNVVDVEYNWHRDHEDLTPLARDGALLETGTPDPQYGSHGTAVMGEIVGQENEFGVTGIAPSATPFMSNAISLENGWTPGAAIALAAEKMEAGDVILLELQVNGCGGGYAPVELDPASYDAIKTATAKGIHVVEAAGNGTQDLDSGCYGGEGFPDGKGDSGAIIVGAGAGSRSGATPGSRLDFSTYGSRVNVQAWGETVTSAGYGDLHGSDQTTYYTDGFSGTSSASPIVTGAVAQISSIAEERGVELDPAAMRDLLVETGTPQPEGDSGKIGPLPNVKAAADSLGEGGGQE